MKRLLLALFLAASTFAAPTPHCGVERWLVKTSADSDWNRVNLMPVSITVAALNALTPPDESTLKASSDVRFPEELHVYTVRAYLVGFKLENDLDFHIVIQDLATADTMIAEMPSDQCVPDQFKRELAALRTSWGARFGKATPKFKRMGSAKIELEIAGVGFFDFLHGQTGVARNGFELHRVLSWREVTDHTALCVGECPADKECLARCVRKHYCPAEAALEARKFHRSSLALIIPSL